LALNVSAPYVGQGIHSVTRITGRPEAPEPETAPPGTVIQITSSGTSLRLAFRLNSEDAPI